MKPTARGAALLAATFAFALAGRPSTLFDCTRGVMVRYFKRIPFADLDHFHAIERRDEEPRMSGVAELLAGPRLVVCATRFILASAANPWWLAIVARRLRPLSW